MPSSEASESPVSDAVPADVDEAPESTPPVGSGSPIPRTGFVAGAVFRLVLVFIVLSEICFLASRHRARFDLTADKLYTLTTSTETILGQLDELLVIEAYFSNRDDLPILHQPARMAMEHTLEEYEKLSHGKLRVRFIDPLKDRTMHEKATRLGMQPQYARNTGAGSTTETEVWQGLRIRYGGRKQDVIPYLQFGSTAFYERALTPLIKRLTVKKRTRIGVLAFRSRPGGRGLSISMEAKTPPQGFRTLIQHPLFVREYDMVPLDLRQGQLIPDDIKIAMLVRPKFLPARVKFVFDQFLMRGGKLVVFADNCEVEVRKDRAFRGDLVPYDAPGSVGELSFLAMLKSYGVKVENKIVGDGRAEQQQLFYDIHQHPQTGQGQARSLPYPFIFEALDDNWHSVAEGLARGSNGAVDAPLAKLYRENTLPGMTTSHELIKALAGIGAPGLFWPCPVGLAEALPPGVTGEVLLRTSPLGWTEAPNTRLDPYDEAADYERREMNLRRWAESKRMMIPSQPMQIPLMVHVRGTFRSFFGDKDAPPAKKDEKTAPKKPDDWDDWGEKDDAKKDDPKKEKGAEVTGPVPGAEQDPKPEPEPKLTLAPDTASLLVVGDATFIRDDFITGMYREANQEHRIPVVGPMDRQQGARALLFFKNLLDWLAQERDLLALQNKVPTDRTIKLLHRDEARQESAEEFHDRVIARQQILHYVNLYAPVVFLFVFGLVVWFVRRAQKRAFLASLS